MTTKTAQVELSHDEALVLFEFLARVSANSDGLSLLEAEKRVIWNTETQLERQLEALFAENYGELLDKARLRLASE